MRLFLTYLLIGCSAVCVADTTITIRAVITDTGSRADVQNPTVLRYVHYRHGTMRRKESFGDKTTASFVSIANCGTKTGFLVDLNTHEYRTYNVVKFWPIAQLQEYVQKNPERAIPIESSTVDTGERKTFFGRPAKHLVTTNRRLPDKTSAGGEETLDGWYIDHEGPDNDCTPDYVHSDPYYYYAAGTALVTYPEISRFHHIGPLPTGLAVKLTYTVKVAPTKDGSLGRTMTDERTVEDLSDSTLSPSLFELPAGFRENSNLLRSH